MSAITESQVRQWIRDAVNAPLKTPAPKPLVETRTPGAATPVELRESAVDDGTVALFRGFRKILNSDEAAATAALGRTAGANETRRLVEAAGKLPLDKQDLADRFQRVTGLTEAGAAAAVKG